MEYHLRIARLQFCIQIPKTLRIGKAFLPFLAEPGTPDIRAEFYPVTHLDEPDGPEVFRESCLRVYASGDGFACRFHREPDTPAAYAQGHRVPGGIKVDYLPSGEDCLRELGQCITHLGLEALLLSHDRLCLHASCVQTRFGGLLFAGPSGIGKSTQAGLWERYRGARQINGDRPILSREERGWMAWGSPYAGSSGVHVNESCPVRAVLILRQAPECCLRKLGTAEAFRRLYACLTVNSWDPGYVARACDLCLALIGQVPVYEFACTADIRAVESLELEFGKDEDGWSAAYR